jgi:hypothetical protein
MIVEAIDRILSLARPETIKVDGIEYSTKGLSPIKPALAQPILVHTLTGVLDWIKAESPFEPLIHVCTEKLVRCMSKLSDSWRERELYIEAVPFDIDFYPFKRPISIENAIIDIQSKFEDSPEKTRVINFLSSIRGQQVITADDDGIAQQVTTSNRIGRLENTKMNPIIELAPFRTFNEIEQPVSKFLLRLQPVEKSLPTVTLFETDGGAWRGQAIHRIAYWFKNNDFVIENNIKIIS